MVKQMELVGERVILRSIGVDDAENIVRWRNDPRIRSRLLDDAELTLARHMDWYNNIYLNDDDRTDFIIIEKSGGRPIGTAGIKDIAGGTPEVSYAIGEVCMLKKGYAQDAVVTLLDYAAQNGCKGAKALVKADNEPSRRFLEKLGFEQAGGSGDALEYVVKLP